MRFSRFVLAAAVLAALAVSAGAADEQQDPPAVTKEKEGLYFTVPPDWPIEKRNGIMAPIPIEEYLGRKFGALDARIEKLDKENAELKARVQLLEDKVGRQLKAVEKP